MIVQFMSETSGLKTKYLGLNTLCRQPRHIMSLSAVCPGKLSRDLGLKSNPKDGRSLGSTQRPLVYNHYNTEASRINFILS